MSVNRDDDHNGWTEPVSILNVGPDKNKAMLWSLVLSALEISHRLNFNDGSWQLEIPESQLDYAIRELACFEHENENWPPPEHADTFEKQVGDSHPPTVLFMGGLLVFYSVTGPWMSRNPWFAAGAVNGEKILTEGEWWRLLTALTLHADPVHVFANAIIGGILVHYLCRMIGSGLGWLFILASGVLGNLINVMLHSGAHLSVGFSTSVFGTVGILTGMQVVRKRTWKEMLLPIGAGVGLLAMLGTEGERTDLGAHLWGLIAGGVIGFTAGSLPATNRLAQRDTVQTIMLWASVFAVWLGWHVALK